MISFVETKEQPLLYGYFLVFLFLVRAIIASFCSHHNINLMFQAGVATRTSLINLIYKKSLRLSTTARRETTVGQIVNIMQENTQIFADASFNFLTAVSAPYQVLLAVLTLYLYLDNSAFVTLGVMILIVPITMLFSILLKVIDAQKISVKDSRVKLLNEVLNGIKVNGFKIILN